MTKELVLAMLREHPEEYISGAEIASRIGVSRNAVWKAVEQLRQEEYPIESLSRRGHRLKSDYDVLSLEGIQRYLTSPELQVRVYSVISSTNTMLKQLASENAPAGLALVAGEQTAGRGRLGRSFYSPSGSGLYLSLLLRPDMEAAQATRLTACAAVAAAEALEEIGHVKPGIKWVNDLYVDGRKVCGILTEAGLDCETGRMSYVVVGIGINLHVPQDDFPEEIRGIAGAAFGDKTVPDLRNRLAAQVLDRLWRYAAHPEDPALFEKYRSRSFIPGHQVQILSPGREPVPALALEILPDFALQVRLQDGMEQLLRSGEISIRIQDIH